jgi:DNA polymerase
VNPRRDAILREMGLAPLWRQRDRAEKADAETAVTLSPPPVAEEAPRMSLQASCLAGADAVPAGREARIAALGWPELEEEIRACRACVLGERRKQAVPGVGDHSASWMFVGEGPGAEEDLRGEPFVGQAGCLLDNMLAALGLKRGEDVYIGNAVKCRPPHNRTPEAAEIAICAPFLDRQIALVQPRLLVALGRPATQALLGREINIAAARGKRFERGGVTVVVTYHPAYLLRNPLEKGKAWEDLCFARHVMEEGR